MLENPKALSTDESKRQTQAQQFFKGQTICSFLRRGAWCIAQAEQAAGQQIPAWL